MLPSLLWLALLISPSIADVAEPLYTHTEYVTPACFQQQIESIMADNPKGQTTGIEIKFVYVNPESTSTLKPQPIFSTSTVEYTVSTVTPATTTVTSCSNRKCDTFVVSTDEPHIYTTWAPYLYTNVQSDAVGSVDGGVIGAASAAGTIEESSTPASVRAPTSRSANTGLAVLTESATTETKTIFSATSKPSATYEYSTSDEPVVTNLPDPLVKGPVVSSKLSKTIETSQFTDDEVTIATLLPNTNELANSSTGSIAISDRLSPSIPSTIDVRVTSTGAVAGEAAAPTGFSFSNNSISSAEPSLESLSSGLISLSDSSAVSDVSSASASSDEISAVSPSSMGVGGSSTSSSAPSLTQQPSFQASGLAAADNLFEPISNDAPLSIFARAELPLALPANVDNNGVPYQTNKFSTNLILSQQTDMIWSYPYGLFWKKVDYYGFAIQHTTVANRVFGPKNENNDGSSYFFNPVQNAEILISGTSFSSSNNYLSVSEMKSMSTLVKIAPQEDFSTNYIEIPIVQGMGFVTSIYHGDLTASLNTLIGFSTVKQESSDTLPSVTQKYRFTLFNDLEYLVYVTLPNDSSDFEFKVSDSFHVAGTKAVDGLIVQIAVAPTDPSHDVYYDVSAGLYPVSASVSGSSSGYSAQYSINYETEGSCKSGYPLVFALPHHIDTLTASTQESATPIQLASTTKGSMTAYMANELQMAEPIEPNVSFLPWSPLMSKTLSYTKDQLKLLAATAQEELSADIKSTVQGIDSNYFAGKVIDKFAQVLLVVHGILQDEDVTKEALENIKNAFEIFTSNQQRYSLMYDTRYGGITSSASQGGDTGVDFGSAYYNDHHFHYGYFIHAAAVVGYVDAQLGGTWAEDNKDWVNNLIRDVANPSEEDSYFPVSRMFDWFAGHSWAGGLFTAGDGRNQESSSEDYHFTYGMKLWGKVIGDNVMEARGDLMLAIQKRAMNYYYLYSDGNAVVPSQISPNKVAGILFDNKIAYTTYFGDANQYPEYVHGIHMLPLTAASALIRGATFVKQEWDQIIASFVENLDSGWAGILRLNQALFDPQSSYEFFSSDNFKSSYLDNGQSRTWSLAFAGGLANSV